jgi:hypothetical protein
VKAAANRYRTANRLLRLARYDTAATSLQQVRQLSNQQLWCATGSALAKPADN